MGFALLLHVCCATCGAFVLEQLRKDYTVTAYYYNPNIYPDKEYRIRRDEAKRYCDENSIPWIEEGPDPERWFALTKGHEKDPERGERCTICYRMRLERTVQRARLDGFDLFATDLSISPHKDAQRLNQIGTALAEQYGVRFLTADFKKKDGFKQAMALSRDHDFYRQNYCGCLYSRRSV